MVAMSQANLLANKKRKFMLSGHISKETSNVNFHWAPFPIEMTGASAFVPSPSGLKLLVVRNPENESSPTKFEIWNSSQLEKEFHIPQKVHGSVYVDGWYVLYLSFFFFFWLISMSRLGWGISGIWFGYFGHRVGARGSIYYLAYFWFGFGLLR